MKELGILITSRNNYRFLDTFWAPEIKKCNNAEKYKIVNIDEDSTDKNKEEGKEVCKKHGILYLDREERGMHGNLYTCANLFKKEGIRYILWCQTDSWPLQLDFLDRFNDMIASDVLDSFGTIGFNGIALNILEQHNYDAMISQLDKGEKPCGVLARSHLEDWDSWYCGVKSRRIVRNLTKHKNFRKPFSIEAPAWFSAAVSVDNALSFIDRSHKFYFHKSWDDISHQFLFKNIHNICLPNLYITHLPEWKPKVDLPKRAVRFAYKGSDQYHSLVGFKPECWEEQWGWQFDKRKTFEKVKGRYKNTLVKRFYDFKPVDGALEVFDI